MLRRLLAESLKLSEREFHKVLDVRKVLRETNDTKDAISRLAVKGDRTILGQMPQEGKALIPHELVGNLIGTEGALGIQVSKSFALALNNKGYLMFADETDIIIDEFDFAYAVRKVSARNKGLTLAVFEKYLLPLLFSRLQEIYSEFFDVDSIRRNLDTRWLSWAFRHISYTLYDYFSVVVDKPNELIDFKSTLMSSEMETRNKLVEYRSGVNEGLDFKTIVDLEGDPFVLFMYRETAFTVSKNTLEMSPEKRSEKFGNIVTNVRALLEIDELYAKSVIYGHMLEALARSGFSYSDFGDSVNLLTRHMKEILNTVKELS